MAKEVGKMSAKVAFNPNRYARLLARTLPKVIETPEENERLLAEVEKLFDKGEGRLSPEEQILLELITRLIQDFEDKNYQINAATPLSILKELMESRGVKPSDLWEVFGSRGVTSEVLSGKRGISKANAKKLAEFFNVSVELFI
jgi:HTH-type transcriptional regulator/antitoxin HigA